MASNTHSRHPTHRRGLHAVSTRHRRWLHARGMRRGAWRSTATGGQVTSSLFLDCGSAATSICRSTYDVSQLAHYCLAIIIGDTPPSQLTAFGLGGVIACGRAHCEATVQPWGAEVLRSTALARWCWSRWSTSCACSRGWPPSPVRQLKKWAPPRPDWISRGCCPKLVRSWEHSWYCGVPSAFGVGVQLRYDIARC